MCSFQLPQLIHWRREAGYQTLYQSMHSSTGPSIPFRDMNPHPPSLNPSLGQLSAIEGATSPNTRVKCIALDLTPPNGRLVDTLTLTLSSFTIRVLDTFFQAFTARFPASNGEEACPSKVTSSPGGTSGGGQRGSTFVCSSLLEQSNIPADVIPCSIGEDATRN